MPELKNLISTILSEKVNPDLSTDKLLLYDDDADALKSVVPESLTGVRKYVARLAQSGTNAPVATVFENTLGGTVVWTRGAPGTYRATLAGAFSNGMPLVRFSHIVQNDPSFITVIYPDSNLLPNTVEVLTSFYETDSTALPTSCPLQQGFADGLIDNTWIEIIVYE